jgi:hypothetical protein
MTSRDDLLGTAGALYDRGPMCFDQPVRNHRKQLGQHSLDLLGTVHKVKNCRKMLPLNVACSACMEPPVSAKARMGVEDCSAEYASACKQAQNVVGEKALCRARIPIQVYRYSQGILVQKNRSLQYSRLFGVASVTPSSGFLEEPPEERCCPSKPRGSPGEKKESEWRRCPSDRCAPSIHR